MFPGQFRIPPVIRTEQTKKQQESLLDDSELNADKVMLKLMFLIAYYLTAFF